MTKRDPQSSATTILWGQILIVGLVALLFVWAATQWTAWRLGFQPELGEPWFSLFGWPVYIPPAFFWWWYWYDAYAPRVFVDIRLYEPNDSFAPYPVSKAPQYPNPTMNDFLWDLPHCISASLHP